MTQQAAHVLKSEPEVDPLRLYAILRGDIFMPAGKAMSQLGHAFTNAFYLAYQANPSLIRDYQGTANLGIKICLKADTLALLLSAYDKALQVGLPCALIIDEHHILPPDFTGEPIITALGIGPARRSEINHITRRFSLIR